MPKPKQETHKYELPCANCKALVTLTPRNWIRYKDKKRLPFCAVNGCRKYVKFLSADPNILEVENDYYSRTDDQRKADATPEASGTGG